MDRVSKQPEPPVLRMKNVKQLTHTSVIKVVYAQERSALQGEAGGWEGTGRGCTEGLRGSLSGRREAYLGSVYHCVSGKRNLVGGTRVMLC